MNISIENQYSEKSKNAENSSNSGNFNHAEKCLKKFFDRAKK